ncbi:MAG: helix-turn-helix transcriptional regulator [Terriglobales bacterium]|jgi:transcriptional regulator with XRE-family HTH domain
MAENPGQKLRMRREALGLSGRQVEEFSARIAKKHECAGYLIPYSRLSEIESKNVVPSIYRLYSLAIIYRCDLRELLSWFEIDVGEMASDYGLIKPPRSHLMDPPRYGAHVDIPVHLEPPFDPSKTARLGTVIKRWGSVPFAFLRQFSGYRYSYGYVGSEDLTMYPLLLPGSFVQIDESRKKVKDRKWRHEFERPIYFIETKNGFQCAWCSRRENEIILQPHPLSPETVKVFQHPRDAEVVGEVVGVAMKLRERQAPIPA